MFPFYYGRFTLPLRRIKPNCLRVGDILTGSGRPLAIINIFRYSDHCRVVVVPGHGQPEESQILKPNHEYEVLA
jgi:hypothetical protein